MTLIAISLVILSAGIHALWNIFSKSKNPTSSFFLLASLFGTALLAPILFLFRGAVLHDIPSQVWVFLVIAGFFMSLYYVSLARAYRAGDLSVAYPIVRALPVVIVLIVVVYLGRADQITYQSVVGGLIVVLGCFMVPLKRFKGFRFSNYWNLTCAMALIAAISTAGYSMVDDEALRYLRNDSQFGSDNTSAVILYAFLEAFITSAWMALYILMRRQSRAEFMQLIRFNKSHAFVAAIGIHLSYTLVLAALAFADNVSYIVAFHRLSIPLGAALGILILKEQPYPTKIIGVLVVLIGLVCIALG
ncbi:MAG: EamA family transporter [Gammaproteobacteria bacterium]